MAEVTTYSKKEEDLKVLCTKKTVIKKKRYYVPNEDDELTKIFNKCLKECSEYGLVEKHNVKFSLHYVYPYISKNTWAHIIRTGPQLKMYSDIDYIIEVSGQIWEIADDKQKDILIEHELEHLLLSENDEGVIKMQMTGHDLEDFIKIIKKYGIDWTEQRSAIQARLEELEEERKLKEKDEAKKNGTAKKRGRPRLYP